MTQLTIKVDGTLVRKGLQDLSAEIPEIGRLQIYQTALHVRTAMRKPGAKPTYPINWDSIKQRKAFFATDGFGGGIPYTRTNRYVSAWNIERSGNDGYRIENNSKGAMYVSGGAYGDRQSNVHSGRWPVFRQVVEAETAKLPKEIEEKIKLAIKKKGLS